MEIKVEYKYFKDLKHSYMIVSCSDVSEDELGGYRLKIVENGRIKKLLPVSLRKIDLEQLLYYEVSSMISLEDRFSSKGMGVDELKTFLTDMKEMLEGLSEYLLGEEGILFDPENIYVNLSTGEYRFMYYPFNGEKREFGEFTEKLLDLTDHDDDQAIEIVYNLCELSKEDGILLPQLIDEALKMTLGNEEHDTGNDVFFEESDEDDYELEEEDDDEDKAYYGHKKINEDKRKEAKRKFIFAFLFAAVAVAIIYIRINFVLSETENLLSVGVILLSVVTGVVAVFTGFLDIKKAVSEYSEGRGLPDDDQEEEDYYDDIPSYKDIETAYKKPLMITSSEKKSSVPCASEETTFLAEEDTGEMTLYSRNAEKTFRIPLDKLPITIGKLEGYVDTVIKDMSISRIHCRFSKEGEKIVVSDLGSTNGTYKNGLKLAAKVKVPIEEGDEIKIGRICFDCR